jgi:heme exporter protein A
MEVGVSHSLVGEELHLWRGNHHVLRGIDVQLKSSQVLELRGANGAGKTSLLRTLAGLTWPEQGRVLWNNADVHADLPLYHQDMVYLGHDSPLKGDLSATENLHYWVGLRRRINKAQVTAVLEQVEALTYAERPVRFLSAGQRRRVALAGVILMDVSLWLLDEPTTHLDQNGEQLVARLINLHLSSGGMVVTALHQQLGLNAATVYELTV